tara:strand:+ start:194 stop:577 length:384 start_codon:yes stop_codon:yes gene_type:complete
MPRYSAETKAAALAMIMAGHSYRETAEVHGCSHMAVKDWAEKANITEVAKKPNISDLLEGYIRQVFLALGNHLALSQDPKWRDKQSASDLAVFDGVHSDKCFRVLEAISRQASESGPALGKGESGSE